MAFIYEKADPKGKSKRWMGRIRIGSDDVAVSLRLKSAGTRRAAQARVDTLQFEVSNSLIMPSTAEWLGARTTAKLNALIAKAMLGIRMAGPESWEAAYLGYLKANEAKDTKAHIPGTAMTINRTMRQRTTVLRKMVRWLTENKVPFHKKPFTQTIIEYINYRKSIGISSVTLWSGERAYCVHWAEWMHKRGLCEKPDREAITEHMPRRATPIVVLPDPADDVAAIRFFRDKRNQVMFEAPDGQKNRSKLRMSNQRALSHTGAWSLALCVRGFGCRPSEATALMWPSISQDLKVVHLLSTKQGVAREVPILFEWVRVGLAELRELHGNEGPVCRTSRNRAFLHDSNVSACWLNLLQFHKQKPYLLKKSQKCFIAQAIRMGFPPHVVANWTGHTLTVQEKHYCEGRSYLPTREADVYREIGVLSAWGEEVRSHLASFANLLPPGRR